jgi:peptide/nickel transport system substrate-binding protein
MGSQEGEREFETYERLLKDWSRRDFLRRAGGVLGASALVGGGLEFLAACGSSSPKASATPSGAKRGGHIVEGSISDTSHFMSVLVSDTVSGTLVSLLFDGLIGTLPNGTLIPLVAESMPTISSDQTTYTFKIRKGIKWTDGTPLTAEDVLFTYQLMWDPRYEAVNSPRRGDLTEHVADISAPDPYTFVVRTKGVYAPFLDTHGGYGILPKHVLGSLAPAAINTASFDSNPTVSNGAFKFVSWEKGQQIVLERNPTYYRGAPLLDQYIMKVVPSTTVLVDQLKTGEVDFGTVDPSLWDSLQGASNLNLIPPFGTAIFTFYAYNLNPATHGGQLFGDQNVRQALLWALDRQAMAQRVFFGQASVADSVEPPISWAHVHPKTQIGYDVSKANAMLDAAGWTKGPDGIRAKNGVKMQFTMITNAGNIQRQELLQIMQQSWAALGVQATPQLIQFPQLVTQITNERTFDMFLVGFSWGQDPDQSELFSSLGTAPGGFNGFDFKNAEVDKLLSEATATLNQAKRKAYYAQYEELMNELQPAPVLVFNKALWAVSKRIVGINSSSFGPYNQYSSRFFFNKVATTNGQ